MNILRNQNQSGWQLLFNGMGVTKKRLDLSIPFIPFSLVAGQLVRRKSWWLVLEIGLTRMTGYSREIGSSFLRMMKSKFLQMYFTREVCGKEKSY